MGQRSTAALHPSHSKQKQSSRARAQRCCRASSLPLLIPSRWGSRAEPCRPDPNISALSSQSRSTGLLRNMLPTPAEPAAPSLPSHCTALHAAGQPKSKQPWMPDRSSPVTVNKPAKPAKHNVQWGFSSQLHCKLQTNCLPIISVVPFYIPASQVPLRLCLSRSPTDAHTCLLPRALGWPHTFLMPGLTLPSLLSSFPALAVLTHPSLPAPASIINVPFTLPGYVLT